MTDTPASTLDAKVVRTSPLLWILGAALALLLAALGTRTLSDMDDLFPWPTLEQFQGEKLDGLRREKEALQQHDETRRLAITRAERDLEDLDRTVSTAEESWRTWLATRATLGGEAGEDRAVRARRDQLDRLRAERDAAAARLATARRAENPDAARLAELDRAIAAEDRAAEDALAAAGRARSLKVLLARLALVVPAVALGAWLWRRRRTTRFPTLVLGYCAFAAWMLGLGVYPYLPYYGGYAPLVIGVGAVIWASVSLVRYFNARAAARRRRIVDQAIARHRCPGCERDYLIGREVGLDLGVVRKATRRHYDAAALHPRACPACGLALFAPCAACGASGVVHLDRCATCGAARAAPASPSGGDVQAA